MESETRKKRLSLFLKTAEELSFERADTVPGSTKVVKLRKVKELLYNLANGREPDEPVPPSWAGKDVVGYLLRRGWKVTDDGEGLQRRGYFIPAEEINMMPVLIGGSESHADLLEIEHAQRTDREDRR